MTLSLDFDLGKIIFPALLCIYILIGILRDNAVLAKPYLQKTISSSPRFKALSHGMPFTVTVPRKTEVGI